MKRLLITTIGLLFLAGTAYAQLGDILRKVDPSKIKKGASAVRAVTKDFSEEEELHIGRIIAARVLATYPLSSNDRLQNYVTLVGKTVAAYSSRPNLDWHFAVLDTPVVNAFSAPAGYIFITMGALQQIGSEAELAAVLGHEIAHTTEKHILREVKRANVIAEGLSLAQDQFGRGGLTDDLAKKIGDVAIDKLFKTGVGRREELDSDRIGIELAGAAGYRQSAFLDFLNSLDALADNQSSTFQQLASTHPRPDDRITAAKPRIQNATTGQLLAERWEQWTAPRGN
jgi:predicted Zn-dependent protease